MIKNISRALVFSALLALHFSPVKAGGLSKNEVDSLVDGAVKLTGAAMVGVGVAGLVTGGVASLGLYKSYQWARYQKGTKQKIGLGILAGTGLAATYGFFWITKK